MENKWRIWGIVSIVIIVILIGMNGFLLWQKYTNQVVAKIDDHNLYYSDWQALLKKEHGREILDEMIHHYIVEKTATTMNINIKDEEIEKELESLSQPYESLEEYLLERNRSLEQMEQEIRFNLLLEAIATHDIVITDQELQSYYEDNIDYYSEQEALHIRQIIVDTFDEAYQITQELNMGSDFLALAHEQSVDIVTADNGGDLGWVTHDDPSIDADILEAAESLDVGEISEPIPLFSGYAIIKLEDKRERVVQPFRTVKDAIKRELALSQSESLPIVLAKLKREYSIKIHKMFQQ